VTHHATGTFDVKLAPLPLADKDVGPLFGRMSIDKRFDGDLAGVSKGEMLTALTPIKDSAGYVAIERVTCNLKGLVGGFTLQHSATMNHGAQQLSITVVPDSGTGALVGLTGTMTIRIVEGQHFYELAYALPSLA
jgi:hypothetical protein